MDIKTEIKELFDFFVEHFPQSRRVFNYTHKGEKTYNIDVKCYCDWQNKKIINLIILVDSKFFIMLIQDENGDIKSKEYNIYAYMAVKEYMDEFLYSKKHMEVELLLHE